MNHIVQEDLTYITSMDFPWGNFKDATILITGATGLIGSMLMNTFDFVSEKYSLNITAIPYTSKDNGGVCFPLQVDRKVDYIFHCAAVTKSLEMIKNPLKVLSVAVDGTRNVLDMARVHRCKSIVYLSSMEVYGQIDGEVTEEMLGYIDLMNPRSCYSESKRMCELLCNVYHSQFGVAVKIARLAQTFGAGTAKTDTRVFAQFARSAVSKTDIILHTEGKSHGNYCYIADTIMALLQLQLRGENGHAYNISTESMTIRDMAELVAREYGVNVKIEIPQDTAKLGYAPTTGYILDTNKIRLLGWAPKYGLLECYKRMIEAWK